MAAGARPAEGVLASSLIGDEEIGALLEGLLRDSAGGKRDKSGLLGAGVKSVDEALGGGLGSGSIVGVWSEAGGGGSELCRAWLVDCLLKYPECNIAVVDTIGNFDILGVYTLLLHKFRQDAQFLDSTQIALSLDTGVSMEDTAAKVLDHVKIMRVFDFVGVREAISEIRDGLEGKVNKESREEPRKPAEEIPLEQTVQEKESTPASAPRRTVVADSEDEDEDEEMLFDGEENTTMDSKSPAPNFEAEPTHEKLETPSGPTLSIPSKPPAKTKLILIDNFAHILNPLLKKDYIQAHALATTFLHTLSNLTRTHKLHTLITNPATHPRAPSPTRAPAQVPGQIGPPPAAQPRKHVQPPPPSIFATNTLVPGLFGVFAKYVDISLLVSRLPRKKMDAKVLYRDIGTKGYVLGQVKIPRVVELVNVVEVMSDRWEGRVGGWGTFRVEDGRMYDLK